MWEMAFQKHVKICEHENRVAKLYKNHNLYKNEVMNDTVPFIFDALAR